VLCCHVPPRVHPSQWDCEAVQEQLEQALAAGSAWSSKVDVLRALTDVRVDSGSTDAVFRYSAVHQPPESAEAVASLVKIMMDRCVWRVPGVVATVSVGYITAAADGRAGTRWCP
jgi:hypothetical protein